MAEEFIGLYQTDAIDSQSQVRIIRDSLLRMNLKLQLCRGQCYDGASNMRFKKWCSEDTLMKNLVQCTATAKDVV